MTVKLQLLEVNRSEASTWMEDSLQQGFDLSSAILAGNAFGKGKFLTLVPKDFKRRPMNFAAGGVIPLNSSREALGEFFDEIAKRGAASVVVEDDMRRASDPGIADAAEPFALVGERLLHWCDCTTGGKHALGPSLWARIGIRLMRL